MMKRNKAILCALASIGFITSVNTVSASAMTMKTTNVAQTKFTVSQVEDLIYKIPSNLTLQDKNIVKAARDAYDSLSKEDQSKIFKYDLSYLKNSELTIERLEKLENDKLKAKELKDRIEELKTSVEYNGDLKEKDKYIEVEYNGVLNKIDKYKLRDSRDKIVKIRNDYESLDYSVRTDNKGNKVVSNMDDFFKLECRLAEVAWLQ